MDDLNFKEPVWSLSQVLHWIAFRQRIAPARDRSVAKHERAESQLLKRWQEGKISPRGLRCGLGEAVEIPQDSSIKAEFDPLGNAIYWKDQWQPEAPWQEVYFFRDHVLALWPQEAQAQDLTTPFEIKKLPLSVRSVKWAKKQEDLIRNKEAVDYKDAAAMIALEENAGDDPAYVEREARRARAIKRGTEPNKKYFPRR